MKALSTRWVSRLTGAVLLCSVALPAAADQPLWELGVGLAGLRLPHYRGADQSQTLILPLPYGVYRGRILRADREGARAVLFETARLDFDLSAAASAPIRSRDNRARQGLPDLAPTLELGPNLNLHLLASAPADGDWKLDLRMPVRLAVAVQSRPRDVGWTATPHLNLDLNVKGWSIGVLAGPLWGSRRMHARLYEVTPEQATPTRAAYRAQGGVAGWQATAGVSRRFGRLWSGAFVRADSLAGATFADSPLVRRNNNLTFGLAMSWVLAESSERVPGNDHDHVSD